MPAIHVNPNNFTMPGSNFVNVNAAWHEESRRSDILRDTYGSAPRKLTNHEVAEKFTRERINPTLSALAARGTKHSRAHVMFGGRHYTLPPARSLEYNYLEKLTDPVDQYGGLGVTQAMYDCIDKSLSNLHDFNLNVIDSNERSQKRAKSFFKKKESKPELAQFPPELIYSFFNTKLAQARVAFKTTKEQAQTYRATMSHHPSSEGDYFLEMQDWAAKHWAGLGEKMWQDEVLTSFPVLTKAEQARNPENRFTLNALRAASGLRTVPGEDFFPPAALDATENS